ncbi:MAG: hypothetical protein WB495_16670 [Xanthobacteraceae bacterium]
MLLPITFGVPWVLLSQLMAEIIFVGSVSYERNSDPDREWLGRAAGWFAATSVVWAVGAFLVFAGALLVQIAHSNAHAYVAASGGMRCSAAVPRRCEDRQQKQPHSFSLQHRVGGDRPDLRCRIDHRAFNRFRRSII